ncbi:MAG: hypothetical protein HS126_21110 [Anaerolineales bacterium]|nr:hypothetical protein [Anaerolineales bacterium]
MSRLHNPLPEPIRHQLALTLGVIELSLIQEDKLYREDLLHLRAELLKLYNLLRRYPEIQDEGAEENPVIVTQD